MDSTAWKTSRRGELQDIIKARKLPAVFAKLSAAGVLWQTLRDLVTEQ